MKKYDVIIIGAGSAGLGNSGVANTLGLKTLLIERNENHFGGDCTNFGCVPSKALIHIADHFYKAKASQQFGLDVSGKADMKSILKYIHSKQDYIRGTEDAAALRSQGIDVIIGSASFKDRNTVRVNAKDYSAKIILLCTGSTPRRLSIQGMEQVNVYTNENVFFDCKELPDHLVVIGGGAIGCELGQCFSRLGSKVTIVNRGARLLSKEPELVSNILEECFIKEGIAVINNAEVESFDSGSAFLKYKDGSRKSIPCDSTLIAAGRIVNTNGLALEKAGIQLTDRGRIKVNDYLQSTNKKVYVVGDAAGTYMFSHGAEKMVRMIWRNFLIPIAKHKNKWSDLSWVTFTDPQVAHFGLTQEMMHQKGIKYYRQDQDMSHDDRAIIQEYTYGRMSIWVDDTRSTKNKYILAGSMIAPNAGELIQELELAKHAKVPVHKLNDRVYPYPVATRINQKTIRGLMDKTITPFKKKMAKIAFRLFH